MQNLTPIMLSDEEARRFISFQKYNKLFDLLDSINTFDTKSGSVVIHFNSEGMIVGVSKEEHFSATVINNPYHT